MMNRLWGSSRCCPCRPSWVPVKSLTVLRSICDRLYCKANVMQSTSTVVPLDFLSLLALGGHGVLYSHIPFHILHRPQHVHFLFFVSFTNSYISFSLTIYLFSYIYIYLCIIIIIIIYFQAVIYHPVSCRTSGRTLQRTSCWVYIYILYSI